MAPLVKLLVVHSHTLFCDYFFELFKKTKGISAIHKAYSAAGAKELLSTEKIKMLFLYDMLEDSELVPFIRNAKSSFAEVCIILFSMSRDVSYIKKIRKLGVKGFVHGSANRKIIKQALDAVAQSNIHYCPVYSGIIDGDGEAGILKVIDAQVFFGFTNMEFEVFKMKANRLPLKEVAEKMKWKYSTAKDYSGKVLNKVIAKGYEDEIDFVWKTGYSVEI